MAQKSLIFTEGFNCGKILKVALDSFHKFHDLKVHVFGLPADFAEITPHPNNVLIDCSSLDYLKRSYELGHKGTAFIFGKVFSGAINDLRRFTKNPDESMNLRQVIHFDSDVVFKKESISMIEAEFDAGYDIVGSRRAYLKNPANIPVHPDIPDATSTFFFGMKLDKIPKYDGEYFIDMCHGVINPLGHEVFDFFDPVTFVTLKNGAKMKFLDHEKVGGQNPDGKKNTSFESNLHLDMGENLAHFGGVGSGYAYAIDKKKQNESYGKWALGRWAIFNKLFIGGPDVNAGPPVIAPDGRWVHGGYDDRLLDLIKRDLDRT